MQRQIVAGTNALGCTKHLCDKLALLPRACAVCLEQRLSDLSFLQLRASSAETRFDGRAGSVIGLHDEAHVWIFKTVGGHR